MTGLSCMGVDESEDDKGKKAKDIALKYGPALISDIVDASTGKKSAAATPAATATATPTWVYPVVAVAGLAVLGGIVVAAVKK